MADRTYDGLLHRLAEGLGRDPAGLPPARRLATEFGISLVTMQKVLRRAAAEGLLVVRQRRPSMLADGAAIRAAQRLAARTVADHDRRLALLLPAQHVALQANPVYAEMVAAIGAEAAGRGLRSEVVPWPAHGQMSEVTALVRRGYRAACAVGFRPEQMISLHLLHERGFPVMVLNRQYAEFNIPSVRFDDEAPTYALAERLISLGHRNLCLVTHAAPGTGADGRLNGWFRCLTDHGLMNECSMPMYMNTPHAYLEFYNRAFRELCAGPQGPTAILFAHAPWAVQFLRDERLRGRPVPDERSLAYFGTAPEAERAYPWCPPLTAIVPDIHRLAQCTLEIVERLLAGEVAPPSIRVPMNVRLTDSIGPAPGPRH
jgi:LacI family transcriptional regulator